MTNMDANESIRRPNVIDGAFQNASTIGRILLSE